MVAMTIQLVTIMMTLINRLNLSTFTIASGPCMKSPFIVDL